MLRENPGAVGTGEMARCHLCFDPARRHAIHKDGVRRQRLGERLRECVEPRFARAVRRRLGLAAKCAARGNIDDPAAADSRIHRGRARCHALRGQP